MHFLLNTLYRFITFLDSVYGGGTHQSGGGRQSSGGRQGGDGHDGVQCNKAKKAARRAKKPVLRAKLEIEQSYPQDLTTQN